MVYDRETKLKGTGVSGGVAVARVCLFNEHRHSNMPIHKVSGNGVEREVNRYTRAAELAISQLKTLQAEVAGKLGKAESEIFVAQAMILEDPRLQRQVRDAIEAGGLNAESALSAVLDADEQRLRELDNEYIRERATDFGEVKRRLLDILGNMSPSLQCAGQAHCQKGKNRIVVAEELTPTLTVGLDAEDIRGIVTERGGVTSHAAILARALGIPAVTGIKGIHSALICGTELLINGDTGEVIVWPSADAVAAAGARRADPIVAEPPVADFEVLANIGLGSDAAEALEQGAEGVGLYRTEFEFLSAGKLLSEDEQYERYAAVVKAFAGRPVTFRMLDVGGDKSAPFFGLPREDNPYLGFRGTRLLLGRPDLFEPQARALARAAAHGPVRVMYPMIVDADQFLAIRRRFEEAVGGIGTQIEHGVMFEVPSACLQASEILEHAAFGSIGTNDLIQYLFAVDRGNELVSYDFSPQRPVLWSLISAISGAARKARKPLSVCGEIAGDPTMTQRLTAAGIRSVSVSARLIGAVRRAARSGK